MHQAIVDREAGETTNAVPSTGRVRHQGRKRNRGLKVSERSKYNSIVLFVLGLIRLTCYYDVVDQGGQCKNNLPVETYEVSVESYNDNFHQKDKNMCV